MSDSAFATTSSRQPLALPGTVATATAWVRGLLRRAEVSLDQPADRQMADGLFPASVGATDRDLVHLARWDDPAEILRRARTETGVRSGLI